MNEIASYIESSANNTSLLEEKNFEARMEVTDFLDFQVLGQLAAMQQQPAQAEQALLLQHQAYHLKSAMEAIDAKLFQRLRADIRAAKYSGQAFKNLINSYVKFNNDHNEYTEISAYDSLDVLINGLSNIPTMPVQTKNLEPEMITFYKTPARVVFELVEKVQFREEDVFFDIGAGLGQVSILVNLLTGIKVRGVEFEPAFYNYAQECAAALQLSNVLFLNEDARNTDYSTGTVFFMFTPFKGEILQAVLALLQQESLHRKIKLVTYGPCTPYVSLQPWLAFDNSGNDDIYRLTVFNSL
ncbi:class I SAM-dependent methyltransferase [Chitinophaga costaii]|nr:hypothetical protein [Chitinophaga costaii]